MDSPKDEINETRGAREALRELNSPNKFHTPLSAKALSTPTTKVTSLLRLQPSPTAEPVDLHAGIFEIKESPKEEQNGVASPGGEPLLSTTMEATAQQMSSTFVGLTEFDESKLPDLPDALNPLELEDPLSLTFEERFIPTLTAHASSIAAPNADGSDIETYRSALDSAFAANEAAVFDLNATLENVTEISLDGRDAPPTQPQQLAELLLEDEPMDVDESYSECFPPSSDVEEALHEVVAPAATPPSEPSQDLTVEVDTPRATAPHTPSSSPKSAASTSPSFPVRAGTGAHQFPRSPKADLGRKMSFLEKSAYADSPPSEGPATPTHGVEINIQSPSPQKAEADAYTLNETIDVATLESGQHKTPESAQKSATMLNSTFAGQSAETPDAPGSAPLDNSAGQTPEGAQNSATMLNSTFDGNAGATPEPPKDESKRRTFNVANDVVRRRTFNVVPDAAAVEEEFRDNKTEKLNRSDVEKRRTFTLQPQAPSEVHESFEAMEVDETPLTPLKPCEMPLAAPSPPVPALQKRLSLEAVPNLPQNPIPKASEGVEPRPASPPLPSKQNQNLLDAIPDVPLPFVSPPVPAVQRRLSLELATLGPTNQNHSRDLPPRSGSPPVPAVLRRRSLEEATAVVVPAGSLPLPTRQNLNDLKSAMESQPRPASPALPALQNCQNLNAPLEMQPGRVSPPLATMQNHSKQDETIEESKRLESPPLSLDTTQELGLRSTSPPLPAMQNQLKQVPTMQPHKRSESPPVPAVLRRQSLEIAAQVPLPPESPPLPTMQNRPNFDATMELSSRSESPPLPALQHCLNLNTAMEAQAPTLCTMQDPSSLDKTMEQPQRSASPPVPGVLRRQSLEMAARSASPPLPVFKDSIALDQTVVVASSRAQSPPVPALLRRRSLELGQSFEMPPQVPPKADAVRPKSPPVPAVQKRLSLELDEGWGGLEISDNSAFKMPAPVASLMKRPPIHMATDPFASPVAAMDALSAKEQTHSDTKDEKDIMGSQSDGGASLDEMFGGSSSFGSENDFPEQNSNDADFQNSSNIILNPADFDYLLTKGNDNVRVDRSSLLLKFDPLLGVPVPVNHAHQQQQKLQQVLSLQSNNNPVLPTTAEESERVESLKDQSQDDSNPSATKQSATPQVEENGEEEKNREETPEEATKDSQAEEPTEHVRMSVEVIAKDLNSDCKRAFDNSNSQSDEKQNNYKMDELEKKIKNEVLKTEDIEKKLRDAEQREEALIKRITEKDKTIAKMNGVIEAYEKAIAEIIAEKEQIIQTYEKQISELKSDRDANYQHLTSLETTFSDLHVKYEKSKEMTAQLKTSEEALLTEKRQNGEYLRLQEQRYEKMKNHAMQQLEIANQKLDTLTRDHATETTKLKALLKKEEISRASMTEQLQQKTRENAELVKICDELINGQGS